MAKSIEERNHQEWLGYIQPVGLVVSIPALLAAQCHINKNNAPDQKRFLGVLQREGDEVVPQIDSFRFFVTEVLGWRNSDLVDVPVDGLPEQFAGLEVVLPEYNETLRPTYVVPNSNSPETSSDNPPWMMLVQVIGMGVPLDKPDETDNRRWQASPHAKFERLLKETQVSTGLLTNGQSIRLVYAPRTETSGYLTFDIDQMTTVAGRPIFAALHMLLCEERLFSLDPSQCLPAILANSRKYQNAVSTKLSEQVLAALFELLRGFQAANDHRGGDLLRETLAENPQQVYHGLLTVLMRMVFILYAEDRGLLSTDEVYTNHYSVSGLFERLRGDAGRYPDTMDQRFGAWAQLLTLFRIIHEGCQHRDFVIPARKGYLFDPERYPFLEDKIPRISDGVVYRVLEDLLILDGERLSYRTLDVEQIGSVYEAIMGFELEVAQGRSIAVKATKSHGAPATINLEALLAVKPSDRTKRLQEWTDQKLNAEATKTMKASESVEDLLAALGKKIATRVTPNVVPTGAMIFQPSDERRRSGSHYTPRSLTEPIVRTTLEPILKQLLVVDPELLESAEKLKARIGKLKNYNKPLDMQLRRYQRQIERAEQAAKVGVPHPDQILDLKVCDPAMGSGAFLVEACRQLGAELERSWHAHEMVPTDIPPDETELLYAQRQVAQRCLYGIDKNVMAVDLAKLSLWLVTLAKDHAFTFLDHSLRHGDSLVGLTREQIIGFHWEPKKQQRLGEDKIQDRLERATAARAKILNARDDAPYRDQETRMQNAEAALGPVRLTADACVSAFFASAKKKQREERCEELFESVSSWYSTGMEMQHRGPIAAAAAELRNGEHPIPPFHWEIEFPEVFARENGGFDAFVGNPPFLGGSKISTTFGVSYRDLLLVLHAESHGNGDLVAHFFRRCFDLLRQAGTFGLIGTNTIAQGDTRATGLRWIRINNGTVFNARRRLCWPGIAAVIVSAVYVAKAKLSGPFQLDDREVESITSFLFYAGGDENPKNLVANDGLSFLGVALQGYGFAFDDSESSEANSIEEMNRLLIKDARNQEVIHPFIGGEEVNTSPTHAHHRYVINFGDLEESDARAWPDVFAIIEQRVKPKRMANKRALYRRYWWQHGEKRQELWNAIGGLHRILAVARVSQSAAFTFLPSGMVYSDQLVCFPFDSDESFAVMQSRTHEVWARLFSSSMKDDLRYSPTDCFVTFPFPLMSKPTVDLNSIGATYVSVRATQMVERDEGLTRICNRFHDPHEESEGILKLRRLHDDMDRAVLRAYGWDDLAETARCEFLLDYEEDEDEDLPTAKRSKKKKPYRLRWPDEFRDEVLARLLELNEQRHKEELLAGEVAAAAEKAAKAAAKQAKAKPDKPSATPLFDDQEVLSTKDRMTLAIVSAWGEGTLVDRLAMGESVGLWINNQQREFRAHVKAERQTKLKPTPDIKQLIGHAVRKGWITSVLRGDVEFVKLIVSPSPLGELKKAEIKKLDQIRAIFEEERNSESPRVEINKEYVSVSAPFALTE